MKFSKNPPALLKGILIGVGTDLPEIIVCIYQAKIMPPSPNKRGRRRRSLSQTLSQLYSTSKKKLEKPDGRHKEIETVLDNNLDTDWKEIDNNDAQYTEDRQRILDTLVGFQNIWDGRLGGIDMAKTHIN